MAGVSNRFWCCPYYKWGSTYTLKCECCTITFKTAEASNAYYNAFCAEAPGWEKCPMAMQRNIEAERIFAMTKDQLIDEVGKRDKKIADQAEKIRSLNERIKEFESGMKEMSSSLDAILAEVARTFGKESKDGFKLLIDIVSVKRNNRDFEVHCAPAKDNNHYEIFAEKKKK